MGKLVSKLRYRALLAICEAFRPKIDVAKLQQWLGFDDDEHDEAVQYLMDSGCFFDPQGLTVDCKQSRIVEVQDDSEAKATVTDSLI